MPIENIEETMALSLEGKSNNFKLAYILAYQLAGSGQGTTAGTALNVTNLFDHALARFNALDGETQKS
jgi:hypothetical protein